MTAKMIHLHWEAAVAASVCQQNSAGSPKLFLGITKGGGKTKRGKDKKRGKKGGKKRGKRKKVKEIGREVNEEGKPALVWCYLCVIAGGNMRKEKSS